MSQAALNIDVVREIETSLRDGSEAKRQEILRRVTDLYFGGFAGVSEQATAVFDDVMCHLINHVESRALVELSARLAPVANAPLQTIRRLARDDAIEVSAPVLAQSPSLNDTDLIEIAKTKSQAHLATIARRTHINEAVTEALVDHGNADVATAVASNAGAQISNLTMAKLVVRAEGDERLTGAISQRADIPRPLFRHLMAQATEAVRARLLALAAPEHRAMIQEVLDGLAAQAGVNTASVQTHEEAQRIVASFSQDTRLTRTKLSSFAAGRRVDAMIAALSVLSGLPVADVYRLFQAPSAFGLLSLCRSIMLDWNAASAVIATRPDGLEAEGESFGDLYSQYEALSAAAAQQLIRHWKHRVAAPIHRTHTGN